MKRYAKLITVACLMGMVSLVAVGCGDSDKDSDDNKKKDKKTEVVTEDVTVDDTTEDDSTIVDGVKSIGDNPWEVSSNDPAAIYKLIVTNMEDYIKDIPELDKEYYGFDYMYCDYNQTGSNDVILYLRYMDETDTDTIDSCFLYYDEETYTVKIQGFHLGVDDDSTFYCEKNGEFYMDEFHAKNGGSTDFTRIVVEEEGISWEFIEHFDEVVLDYEGMGYFAVPLYGAWETTPFDNY